MNGRHGLRRVLLVVATGAALGLLLLAVNPRAVATAMGRFDARLVAPLLLLSLAYYALQGLRWHLLLRHVGVAGRAAESMAINLAGQAMSAVVPLGDLTRGLLIARAAGVRFSAAAATITVQELLFTVLVVAAAAPGLAQLPNGRLLMAVVTGGLALVVAILTVPRLFAQVRRLVGALPLVRRFERDVDALQHDVLALVRRPDVLAGTVLDLARVVIANAALLLILRGLHVSSLGWWDAALVLGVSFVGGALSLLPGGLGANEAGVTALLVLLGVNPGAAAAAALVQRVWLVAVPTLGGAVAYLHVRALLAHPAGARAARDASVPAPAALTLQVSGVPVDYRERVAA